MSFSDPQFILFCIPLLVILLVKQNFSTFWLTIISFIFYATSGILLPIIAVGLATFDWYLSKWIERAGAQRSKLYLYVGIAINLLLLLVVKARLINAVISDDLHLTFSTIVPIGISFYTLQAIGYLIDVQKGKLTPPENYFDFLAYILFFPQLLAGPIERAQQLIPQLQNNRLGDAGTLAYGLRLFFVGIYLKLVLANRLGEHSLAVANSNSFDIVYLINGIVVTVFVYSDFFSYTLMARGIALFFNINLQINFDRPFSKKTATSFWQSWHISLTKWMTNYFYIPMVRRFDGSSASKFFFTITTMGLIGLWHGLSLNFLVFGVINGCALQFNARIAKFINKYVPAFPADRILLYIVMMIAGNVFIFQDSSQFLQLLHVENYSLFDRDRFYSASWNWNELSVAFLSAIPLGIYEFSSRFRRVLGKPDGDSSMALSLTIAAAALVATLLTHAGRGGAHVYYQF